MKKCSLLVLAAIVLASLSYAEFITADEIPKVAWKRPLGAPLPNPGKRKNSSDIDDGYWQGAPVGGFGAGTFSRTYRGDFARWHIKSGVHKYAPVYANQFAMFQQVEGEPAGTARVLMTGHPENGELSGWQWDYPVGAGEYAALYPKSWFDYRWEKFPAHVVLEQFSPVLPDNYRESSYPVAVYRWHAENPTNRTVTVSVLLSWTNMEGWFRGYTHDFQGALNQGNQNHFQQEAAGASGSMKGIVFDRNRAQDSANEWDGEFTIAALESPGVEVTYQTQFLADGDGKAVWAPFSRDGRLANSSVSRSAPVKSLPEPSPFVSLCARGKSASFPWLSPGIFRWCNSAKVAVGTGVTPIFTARMDEIPGPSLETACCTPRNGAKP